MKKVLGVPVALIIVLGLVGLTTALLVSYLSNTTTSNLSAASPLEMRFDDGTTSMTAAFFGGETINYTVWTKNLASVEVNSYPVTQVTAPTGQTWTGQEFEQIILADPNYPGGIDVTSMMYYVKSDGSLGSLNDLGSENLNTVKLFFDNDADGVPQTYSRPVGFDEWNEVSITLSPAISPGDYIIKSCQLYVLTGEC